jgi:hypothetical protein
VGTSYNNGDGYSLGEVFVPTQNMNVDFLGYYTNGGGASGLTEDHSVSLYDASGNLLATTTVDSSAAYFTTHFVYNSISTVELLAGQTYVIDGASGLTDPYAYDDTGFHVYAPINLLGDNWVVGNNSDFTGTTVIGDVTDGYWGPDFGYNTSVTPEPSSLWLLGSGLASLAGMLRRKLRA